MAEEPREMRVELSSSSARCRCGENCNCTVEEARYTQSAADLSRMKKEAVGRDDKGRW